MVSGAGGDSRATTPEKADAMRKIEKEWFGDAVHGSLQPYQRMLREARQAHEREDYKAERLYYRQVLDLLRTEPRGGAPSSHGGLEQGITGSREHDHDLEKLIITVLGD